MTLLALQKLEVVYQRSITAVQGVSLAVGPAQIVALLGTVADVVGLLNNLLGALTGLVGGLTGGL